MHGIRLYCNFDDLEIVVSYLKKAHILQYNNIVYQH